MRLALSLIVGGIGKGEVGGRSCQEACQQASSRILDQRTYFERYVEYDVLSLRGARG